jgi:hypothetical protein
MGEKSANLVTLMGVVPVNYRKHSADNERARQKSVIHFNLVFFSVDVQISFVSDRQSIPLCELPFMYRM